MNQVIYWFNYKKAEILELRLNLLDAQKSIIESLFFAKKIPREFDRADDFENPAGSQPQKTTGSLYRLELEQPLVSIIIPGKNEGKHIYKLVKSLREQTYQNTEIMVRVFYRHGTQFPTRAELYRDHELFPVHLHELLQIPGVFAFPHGKKCGNKLFFALYTAYGHLFWVLPAGSAHRRLYPGACFQKILR